MQGNKQSICCCLTMETACSMLPVVCPEGTHQSSSSLLCCLNAPRLCFRACKSVACQYGCSKCLPSFVWTVSAGAWLTKTFASKARTEATCYFENPARESPTVTTRHAQTVRINLPPNFAALIWQVRTMASRA